MRECALQPLNPENSSFKPGKQRCYNRVQPEAQMCRTQQFGPLALTLGAAELGYSIWLSKAGLRLPEVRETTSTYSPVPGSLWVGAGIWPPQ